MKEQSSFRERAKFSRKILCSRWRIFQSSMPNEHPQCMEEDLDIHVTNTFSLCPATWFYWGFAV